MRVDDTALPETDALERIKQAVGDKGWSDDPATMAPFLIDQRDLFHGRCAMLVRPNSTAQVAAVVEICAGAGIAMVPQGGNTGLVGAGIPNHNGASVLISLGRMNTVRDVVFEHPDLEDLFMRYYQS